MKCYYCEREMVDGSFVRQKNPLIKTRDHVIPQCRGGKRISGNIVLCCGQCNFHKGSKSLWQWYCFLQSRAVVKFKTESTWRAFIPTIIKNIQRHPLYKPEIEFTSHRRFEKVEKILPVYPIREAVLVNGAFDPNNFHEDYAGNALRQNRI